ncbi:hypothetical protein VFPPC_17982 [Pochonia chlamydosporia 170]|uniref:Uncharacterized protein n=1 Tax=Pochonia chlamydosporia 170 TaxID=1380566 RepID=A0A219ARL1_METCM|nr:hypothetical protein VFPPC_17982 [Pochonia chlamydosporia 170]OWT42825.1 hypothetical protein VFPPC_17982 [Pochonia chlamydosporia 170]
MPKPLPLYYEPPSLGQWGGFDTPFRTALRKDRPKRVACSKLSDRYNPTSGW